MTAYADIRYGSKVIPNDRSNYWRHYGLYRDPFLPLVEDSNFFLPARWEQYFDLLQYLCESTNILLSVVGMKGSGKTTFMRQFMVQASENAQVCRLVGSTVLTPAQLSETLIKDFDLEKPQAESSEERWEALCQTMQSSSRPYLLVIDDAHRLPQETQKVIVNLIRQQSEHQMRLHILLVGERQLIPMLEAFQEGEADRELVHTITLESLSLPDTEAYIKHRLMTSGLPGGMPLRAQDLGRIYKLSEGVPGRINAVARQVLIDVMQQRQLYGFAHFVRTRRTPLLGAAVLLVAMVTLGLFLSRGGYDPAYRFYKLLVAEKTFTPAASSAPATPAAAPVKAMVMPTSIISSTPTQSSTNAQATINTAATAAPNASITQNAAPSTQNMKEASSASTTASSATPANPNKDFGINVDNQAVGHSQQWFAANMVEFKNAGREQHGQMSAPTPANVNSKTAMLNAGPVEHKSSSAKAAHKTVPVAAVATTLSTAETTAGTAENTPSSGSDKLLSLDSPFLNNPKHFTLQLLGVSSEAAAAKFIDKNQLGDGAYYYNTRFHDKNWYVVILGDFPSRQAATAAAETLSAGMPEIHPVQRSIASVKESIRHGLASANTLAQPEALAQSDDKALNSQTSATPARTGTSITETQDKVVEVPLIE